MAALGPTEEDVQNLATLVHASKRASAKRHNESVRREWKRGDRYLDTSTRLFEVANRIASFAERSNRRLPSAVGIDEERVSAQPDVLVPPVPRGLAEERSACSSGSRNCRGRRIWSCHHAVRIQQPKPRTIAMSVGRASCMEREYIQVVQESIKYRMTT